MTLSLRPGSGILLPSGGSTPSSQQSTALAAALLSQQGTPVLHELQAILSIETVRWAGDALPGCCPLSRVAGLALL
jgi:hypothetical protein